MSPLSNEQKTQIQIKALSTLTAYALSAAHETRPHAAQAIKRVSEAMIEDVGEQFSGMNDRALADELVAAFAEQVRSTVALAVSLVEHEGPKSES